MTEHEEEYEGVTLYVDADGRVKIIGDPIWSAEAIDDEVQSLLSRL